MSLNLSKVEKAGGNFTEQEPLDAGAYPCRVVQVIDLGVQAQRPFDNKPKPPKPTMMITYEFLDEFILNEDGEEQLDKPRWLSEDIPLNSLSSDLAKSTKRYTVLDPKLEDSGNFVAQLGKPVIVTVVQNPGKGNNAGKIYNNVAGISAMRSKDAGKAAELVNKAVSFELDAPDIEVFNSLPEWIQNKIKDNLDYNNSPLQEALGEEATPAGEDDGEW